MKTVELCNLHYGDIFRFYYSDGSLSAPCSVLDPFFTDNLCSFVTNITLFDYRIDYIFNKSYVLLLFDYHSPHPFR